MHDKVVNWDFGKLSPTLFQNCRQLTKAHYNGVDVRFSKFITPRVSLVVFMEMSAFDQ